MTPKTRPFDPALHCGALGRQSGLPCRQYHGSRTDHPGDGNCWLHFGRTPNGNKHGATLGAARAAAALGIPRGTGDPFALLAAAVQHAQGHLEATSQLVQDAASADPEIVKTARLDLAAAVDAYELAIRNASRTGKAAVDADVADRLAVLDERASGLLMRFVGELLERVVPKAERPALEAWASMRLGELATEYARPGAVH